jgi:hypothetical protein
MKKLLVLAMMATLLMAGSAFAVQRTVTAPNATFSFGAPGIAVGPTTTNNDDSCDIGTAPAATLLLPYFEVDVNPTVQGQTTLFTITNVTRFPQIAHVTVWTDWSFPVLDFNIFLTGYDVQPINLYDVIVRGIVAPPSGTTSATTPGALSASNTTGNNNLLLASAPCTSLIGNVPLALRAAVQSALTTGVFNPGSGFPACSTAGGTHTNAIGYVTVDVAADCSTKFPNDPTYYNLGTGEILFDNVLIGDYQQLGPAPAGTGAASSFDGAGNPMVHIRAVPEGGGAGLGGALSPGTNLPYTFYDRYTPAANRTIDRRQPLPSTFAARFIQGGTGAFATNYKIWREGVNGSGASCASFVNNGSIPIGEFVRFDEHENPTSFGTGPVCSPCGVTGITLPETSSQNTAGGNFPSIGASGDVGGWMYLNLADGPQAAYSVTGHPSGSITVGPATTPFGNPRASQNWVIVEMFGSVGTNRLSVDFDAAWLGNGCSPAAATSTANGGVVPIGPAGGVFVCPPLPGSATLVNMSNGTTTQCTGTNTTPNLP